MTWNNAFSIVFVCSVLSSTWVYAAQQPEYILDEQPVAESASEMKGSLETSFVKLQKKEPLFSNFQNELKNLAPFWRDTDLRANFRSYYFNRDRNQSFDDSLAWTYGGSLEYQSGWWHDFIKLGAKVYTSQKIIAPDDKDGTLLLKRGQHGLVTLGEAYIVAQLKQDLELKIFRQTLNLPYLNKQDSRMVPNTFEAYMLEQSNSSLEWILGYVRKMKKRDSDEFKYMSQTAGFKGNHKGQAVSGARYALTEKTDIGVINFFTEDYMNTFYSEANHVFLPENEIPIKLSFQYTNQQSTGSELGGEFDTYSFGGQISLSYKSIVLTAAATSTGKNKRIQKPFGGTPSYISLMINDFDRAGEDAWLVGLSYHFKRLGLEGLSAYTNYASGSIPSNDFSASSNQSEWDITVDYKPQDFLLNGLWLRLRRASLNRNDSGIDITDYRIILNYELQFL